MQRHEYAPSPELPAVNPYDKDTNAVAWACWEGCVSPRARKAKTQRRLGYFGLQLDFGAHILLESSPSSPRLGRLKTRGWR